MASPVGPASLRAVPLLEGVGARSSFGLAGFAVFGQAGKAVGDCPGRVAAEALGMEVAVSEPSLRWAFM